MDAPPADIAFEAAASQIIDAGRRMDRFGWVPSIGGNISIRLDAGAVAITRSGGRKGFLTHDGVMKVDRDGRSLTEGARPSAETLLHCQVYNLVPAAGAVLHGHSIAATVLSRHSGDAIALSGYEMIKAFEGQLTHETTVDLRVFDNDQDMNRLAATIAPSLATGLQAYVLRGHGVYVWGRTMEQAIATLEAVEFLLTCELETRKLGKRSTG